jgi:hypothetical protein
MMLLLCSPAPVTTACLCAPNILLPLLLLQLLLQLLLLLLLLLQA